MSSFRKQLVTMVELQRAEIEIREIEHDMAGIDERIEALNVEVTDKGVTVEDEALVASLSEGFAIVGGKLYETEWETK